VLHTHTRVRLTALCPGLPGWAGTRNVKPIWILLEQETVSGSGISWALCKSAPRSRQITTPAPHHSVFYKPDALPTNSERQSTEGQRVRSQINHTPQTGKQTRWTLHHNTSFIRKDTRVFRTVSSLHTHELKANFSRVKYTKYCTVTCTINSFQGICSLHVLLLLV